MRTLIGLEAIDVAERLNILLFDSYYGGEVTAEQAKLFMQQKLREPVSFVLEDWPDTDKEAEQCVLRRFHMAMIAGTMVTASISDIFRINGEGRGIHHCAAELAARRLVEQKELEVVQGNGEETLYRIPINIRFTESFVDDLRDLVCNDCAHLNPDKPFHKTCLLALIDYLINGDFVLDDVIVAQDTDDVDGKRPKFLKQGAGRRWLLHTVSATKWRWNSVVKPILSRDHVNNATMPSKSVPTTEHPIAEATSEEPVLGEAAADTAAILTRDTISKAELISYLQSVVIADEDGESAQLKAECHRLRKRLEAREHEIMNLERQRTFLQGQCEDMQRDLDTLLQAMQIAKRRGHVPPQVIDADMNMDTMK